jgi:hypothetical protein
MVIVVGVVSGWVEETSAVLLVAIRTYVHGTVAFLVLPVTRTS